jgi:steroid delta-isomerase-like uncharacterized protein
MTETRPEPIDSDALREFSKRYLSAWNSHDGSAVAACATADVIWDSPALPVPVRGRSEVAGLVDATHAAFPDFEFSEPSPPAIAEDRLTAYFPWRMTGNNTGSFDPPGYAPTGRRVDLTGIDVWQFRDGLICRYRAVYNYSELGRQLGLLPPRGGSLERFGVRAQRALSRLPLRPWGS